MAVFREQGWAGEALTARAKLRVEVTLPAVVHQVPLKAVERWVASPSASPKEASVKKAASEVATDRNFARPTR
jgi:hypothetical protein